MAEAVLREVFESFAADSAATLRGRIFCVTSCNLEVCQHLPITKLAVEQVRVEDRVAVRRDLPSA